MSVKSLASASASFLLPLSFLVFSELSFAAGRYTLVSVPNDEVDLHLVIGTTEAGVPERLTGLWWMDGNPLADEVLSFANVHWQEIIQDGEVTGYRGELPVYDEGVWAWHDSLAGRLLYTLVLKSKLTYIVEFNKDFSFGQVTPHFNPSRILPGFDVPASMLVNFTISTVDENEYRRDTILFGQHSSYRFRRVVDGQGNRLPDFSEYLRKAEVSKQLLPICSLGNDTLPTACTQ